MLLKLKNKIINAMEHLLDEVTSENGLPEEFVLNVSEARSFLRELNVNKDEIKDKIKIEQLSNAYPDLRLLVWGKKPLTESQVEQTIENWLNGAYKIEFKHIPVVIAINM